jgi:hypothetical protein
LLRFWISFSILVRFSTTPVCPKLRQPSVTLLSWTRSEPRNFGSICANPYYTEETGGRGVVIMVLGDFPKWAPFLRERAMGVHPRNLLMIQSKLATLARLTRRSASRQQPRTKDPKTIRTTRYLSRRSWQNLALIAVPAAVLVGIETYHATTILPGLAHSRAAVAHTLQVIDAAADTRRGDPRCAAWRARLYHYRKPRISRTLYKRH